MKFWKFTVATAAIIGAILVALNIPESKYGFPLFLYASTSWVYFAYKIKEWSLLCIEFTFCIINILGIYRWLL